jgi:serine/threonine protein phosphatase PrpC
LAPRIILSFHLQNFGSKDDTVFCGVFDGHGPNGHLVAKRVRDLLPVKLSANLGRNGVATGGTTPHMVEDTDASLEKEENDEPPEFFPALRASFLRAFYVMDRDLKLHRNIDCAFSGTTAVTVIKQVELHLFFWSRLNLFMIFHALSLLKSYSCFFSSSSTFIFLFLQGQNLIIGNLGDSRAVLGTRDEENHLVAVQLTVDLKPSIPSMIHLHLVYYYFRSLL